MAVAEVCAPGDQLNDYGARPPEELATADPVHNPKHCMPVPPLTTVTITICEIFNVVVAIHDLVSVTLTV